MALLPTSEAAWQLVTVHPPKLVLSAGQEVTEQLRAKVGPAAVRCETKAQDQYGRKVAICRTDALELNEWLVTNGLAVAYRRAGRSCACA